MTKIYKIASLFIILFSFINTSNADFLEDLLDLETGLQEIKFNFVKLENPYLKNSKYQRQFDILKTVNPKIQKAILNQYKSGRFGYYQTLGLVEHYNNFIYYSNKYFSSLKDKEIYGDTKEVQQNIYDNFSNMKHYYTKFKNLAVLKDMN